MLLKVSLVKVVMMFRIKGELNPRFIGHFEILEKYGDVVFRLVFPPHLAVVHKLIHVSMMKKYGLDDDHII